MVVFTFTNPSITACRYLFVVMVISQQLFNLYFTYESKIFFPMYIMHIYLQWTSPATFSLRYPDLQSSAFHCNQPLILTNLNNLSSSANTITSLPPFLGYFWTCWQVQTPAPAPEKFHWSPPYAARTGCSLLTSVFYFLTEFFFLSTIPPHMPVQSLLQRLFERHTHKRKEDAN